MFPFSLQDYCLVDEAVHDEFVQHLVKEVLDQFTSDPKNCPHYGRMLPRQFASVYKRLRLTHGDIVIGGEADESENYIAPTIVTAEENDELMMDEIFGPILIILKTSSISSTLQIIRKHPTPLSLYVFGKDRRMIDLILNNVNSGSAAVNDAVTQIFYKSSFIAGVGTSGLGGGYGGETGFHTFSHARIVLRSHPLIAKCLHSVCSLRNVEKDWCKSLIRWM